MKMPKSAKIAVTKDRLLAVIKKLEDIEEAEFGDEFDSLINNAMVAIEMAARELAWQ